MADFVQKDYFETKTAYPITISLNLNLVLSQYDIHVDHFQNIFNNVIYLLNSFNSTIPYFSNIAFTTTEALLNSPSLSKNFVFEKEKDSLEVRDSIKLVFDTLFTQLSQNPHFTITEPSSYINNCLLYQSLNNTLSIKNKQDKLPKVKI